MLSFVVVAVVVCHNIYINNKHNELTVAFGTQFSYMYVYTAEMNVEKKYLERVA